jgi:hypothetical protein
VTNCQPRSVQIRQLRRALEDWWRRVAVAWSSLPCEQDAVEQDHECSNAHLIYVCFSGEGDTIMVEALMRLKGGRLGPNSAFSLATSLVTLACRSSLGRKQKPGNDGFLMYCTA